jgi:hypothetical protein
MNINRHNYEEFFVLYLDNELSAADSREVELFAQQNPDLQEELDLLLQSKLPVDDSIVFAEKETLLKSGADTLINTLNYEQWLVRYTDNELTNKEKQAVEDFIVAHPHLQDELRLLQQTKSHPDTTIVFPNKQTLYRKEEKVKVIAIHWRRIAIAAAILFAVSITSFIIFTQNRKADKSLANTPDKIKTITPFTDTPASLPTAIAPAEELASTTDKSTDTNKPVASPEITNTIATTNSATTPIVKTKKINVSNSLLNLQSAVGPENDIAVKKDNNLPTPRFNPNVVTTTTSSTNVIAKTDVPVNNALTNEQENKPIPTVTSPQADALYTTNTLTETDADLINANQSGKKNKLRGFFRKITRTFEKTTNIKATDEEDRLLVGGLAIKL